MSDTIETLDLEGACDFLKLRPSTVYQMCSERRLPYRKAGGKNIFFKHELVNFLEQETARALGRPRRTRSR